MLPKIALLGRPNVGKSTLFNRLIRSNRAITHDRPGVTRDRMEGVVRSRSGRCFTLIDTGGVTLDSHHSVADGPEGLRGFEAEILQQTQAAMDEASVFCLVVDGRDGLMPFDEHLASFVRRAGKPTLLVVNKVDGMEHEDTMLAEFHALGFEFVDEPQREMKPCGGRGSRAFLLAINRLITVLILKFFVNIRRERHFAYAGKNVLENAVENKSDDSSAVIRAGDNFDFEFLVHDENNALFALFPWFYKTFPIGEILPFKEQNFNFAAMFRIRENPRRINLRRVYDEKVAGF